MVFIKIFQSTISPYNELNVSKEYHIYVLIKLNQISLVREHFLLIIVYDALFILGIIYIYIYICMYFSLFDISLPIKSNYIVHNT